MKHTLGALLCALLGACAAPPPRPAPAVRAYEVRGAADALRVDPGYRPAPTGGEVLAVDYEHPARTYYATCWTRGRYASYSCPPASSWRSLCEKPRYRCY